MEQRVCTFHVLPNYYPKRSNQLILPPRGSVSSHSPSSGYYLVIFVAYLKGCIQIFLPITLERPYR